MQSASSDAARIRETCICEQPTAAAHAHVLVDLEEATGVEPHVLQPDVVGRRLAPDRDEHPVGLGRSVVGRRDDVRVAVPAEPYDAPAREDLDAVLPEAVVS